MSASVFHTCAVTASGNAKCWGNNTIFGFLGNGSTVDSLIPVDVTGLTTGTDSISAGERSSCALTAAGGVKCWGQNSFGQLGDGTNIDSLTPVDVVGLTTGVNSVDVGTNFACAVVSGGSVKCWGGFFGRKTTPASVTGLSSQISSVSVGGIHACALTTGGAVDCWSGERFGLLDPGNANLLLGDGSLTSGIAAVSAGDAHSCALTAAGGAKCWGYNNAGQLGDGSVTDSIAPVDVTGLSSGLVAIDAGGLQSCAVTSGGAVKCWGGKYGNTPVDVSGFSDTVVDVSVGGDHVCALTANAEAHCWGNNGLGQLGDGTTVSRSTPATVVDLVAKPTATPTACPPAGCPTPTPTPTCPAEACMALAVWDATGTEICHSDENTKCKLPTGSSFQLIVEVVAGPAGGYVLAQTWVDWAIYDPTASENGAGPGTCGDGSTNGDVRADRLDPDCVTADLNYKPSASLTDEIVWPDCQSALALRFGTTELGFAAHSCLTGLIPPLPSSEYTGDYLELDFNCSEDFSTTVVKLLALDHPNTLTSGALFVLPNEQRVAPQVGSLTINCVDVAPPAAVGGLVLDSGLRGIAAQNSGAPWLWAALGFGVIAALSALAVARRRAASG